MFAPVLVETILDEFCIDKFPHQRRGQIFYFRDDYLLLDLEAYGLGDLAVEPRLTHERFDYLASIPLDERFIARANKQRNIGRFQSSLVSVR